MFGMGGSEIIVILIVALLFLGPEKLPQAAKSISKGIRDIKKQSRALQQQIESDEQIGGAIRDLKSALRGEDLPIRPKPYVPPPQSQLAEGAAEATVAAGATAALGDGGHGDGAHGPALGGVVGAAPALPSPPGNVSDDAAAPAEAAELSPAPKLAPTLKLSPLAGEADPVDGDDAATDDLASLIKPASGTVAKGS
jgi:sec-independent protein translocase protein TatB